MILDIRWVCMVRNICRCPKRIVMTSTNSRLWSFVFEDFFLIHWYVISLSKLKNFIEKFYFKQKKILKVIVMIMVILLIYTYFLLLFSKNSFNDNF